MSPAAVDFSAVVSACDVLRRAGWAVVPPLGDRLRVVSIRTLADILEVGETKARTIARELPGTVMLPGGDLRVRLAEVQQWLGKQEVGRFLS